MNDQQFYARSAAYQQSILALALLLALTALVLVQAEGWHFGFRTVQSISGQLPALFWETLTTLGDERILLALLLPFCLRYPRVFWAIVLGSVIGALLSRGIKIWLLMPRPAAVLPAGEITIIGARLNSHSFPSGHTVSVFAFATVWVAQLGWRKAWPMLGLAMLIGWSRVAVGAHWPIDALGGAVVGTVGGWAGLLASRHWGWGLRAGGHGTLVLVVAIAALTLPFDAQGYPGSLPWRIAVCLWGTIGFGLVYLRPLWRDGWQTASRNMLLGWQAATKA